MNSPPPRSADDSTRDPARSPGFDPWASIPDKERTPAPPPVGPEDISFDMTGGRWIQPVQHRTLTDWLVDVLTPAMIFTMVFSVVYFLLDVRYVYLDVQHLDRIIQLQESTLRIVAFCFVLGIVALNRLIVRDGGEESFLYIAGLAIAIGLYTLATTQEIGSVANNFLERPYLAAAFNMGIVAFLWWGTNRLAHECCVDENPTAGDIGIFTGTARRVQTALRKAREAPPPKTPSGMILPMYEYDGSWDPAEWKPPVPKPKRHFDTPATAPLSNRHPGISVFYASIPVMLMFAVGQHVLQTGGNPFPFRAAALLLSYTVAALMLLMLSSLGGLREYFRSRGVRIPAGIGPFWIGVGTLMIGTVAMLAEILPFPGGHAVLPAEAIPEAAAWYFQIAEWAIIGFTAAVGVYAVLRAIGFAALAAARRLGRAGLLGRLFSNIDRMLEHITKMPSMPHWRRRVRVDRSVATCTRYTNPLLNERMTPADTVQYAYAALCALARDMGVPRKEGETPYEFIASFPESLKSLREHATKLTELYMLSAYSNVPLDEKVQDRVRAFWFDFERVRRFVLR